MATKKTTSKKAPTKKTTTVRMSKAKRTAKPNLIGLQAEDQPFMTFRASKETFYWIVLGLVVILFAAWIMHLQADIQSIYDNIDSNTMLMNR